MFKLQQYLFTTLITLSLCLHSMQKDSYTHQLKEDLRTGEVDAANWKNDYGQNWLHLAIEDYGDFADLDAELIFLLLQAGIDIDDQSYRGNTALHYAVFRQDSKVLQILIEAGANINIKNKSWNTPLHSAAMNPYWNTPLHDVVQRDITLVKLLIAAGANVTTKNGNGLNVWHILVQQTGKDIKEECIKTNMLAGRLICECTSDDVDQELSLLLAGNSAELETLFLADPLLINKPDKLLGATLLMYAATLGYQDMVDFLFKQGADPFVVSKDDKNVFDLIEEIVKNPKLSAEQVEHYQNIMRQCKNLAYNQLIKPLQIACLRQNQVCIPRDTISNHLLPAMIAASKGNNPPSQQPPNSPPSAFSSNNIWKQLHQIPSYYDKKSLALTLVGVAAAAYTSYHYLNTRELAKPVDNQPTFPTTNIQQENIL